MSPECDPHAVLLPESFTPSVGLPCPVLRTLPVAQYSIAESLEEIYHIQMLDATPVRQFWRNEQNVNSRMLSFCKNKFTAEAHLCFCGELTC